MIEINLDLTSQVTYKKIFGTLTYIFAEIDLLYFNVQKLILFYGDS